MQMKQRPFGTAFDLVCVVEDHGFLDAAYVQPFQIRWLYQACVLLFRPDMGQMGLASAVRTYQD